MSQSKLTTYKGAQMRFAGIGVIAAGVLAMGGYAWANTVGDVAASPSEPLELPTWNPDAPATGPVQLIVSVPEQRVSVYESGRLIANSPVSTGQEGFSTPTGVFSILQKKKHHRSNIYSGAPMPFMQRLTWSGIALDASNQVPDYPASHGCVRLPPEFAKKLFGFTEMGAHVVISGTESAPLEISHPNLLQPIPLKRPVTAEAGSTKTERSVNANPPVRILVTRRTGRELVHDVQRLLKGLGFEPGELDGWMGRDTGASIARFQESRGLQSTGAMSMDLVKELYRASRKGKPPTGHIYVRQNFAPVFDAPIAIARTEDPLGNHLFTAMDFEEDATEARWLAVTLNDGARDVATLGDADEEAEISSAPASAKEALDRIDIPDSVRRRISKMLTSGSSLAITDNGISIETVEKGTDFVVLTH